MRLRRLELVVIAVTLAFACFIGGFFVGRNWNAVNIVSIDQQQDSPQQEKLQDAVSTEGNSNVSEVDNPTIAATTPSDAGAVKLPDQPTEQRGDGRININIASQSELMDLPGIGNVLASRIVDYRRQYGDFSRIEDIRNVSGIGVKRFDAIKDMITVG